MYRKLFLLSGCLMMVLAGVRFGVAAEVGQGLNSQEVVTLLTHKTFFVKQYKEKGNDKVLAKDYHAYFGPDGSIQINYSSRKTKSGQWTVGGHGELCIRFTKRGGTSTRRVTKCGILVKKGPYTFDRITDKGVHTATLTLVANGNKFPLK